MNGYDTAGLRNETAYHLLQTGNKFTWLCVEDSTGVDCSQNIAVCFSFK